MLERHIVRATGYASLACFAISTGLLKGSAGEFFAVLAVGLAFAFVVEACNAIQR